MTKEELQEQIIGKYFAGNSDIERLYTVVTDIMKNMTTLKEENDLLKKEICEIKGKLDNLTSSTDKIRNNMLEIADLVRGY